MAKYDGVLGVYAYNGKLAFALKSGKKIKTAWVDVPENIVKDEKLISRNLFAEFIKDTIKANGLKAKKASYVIGSDKVLIRDITVPKMNDEQLKFNLPFEFRDYIRGELKEYMFDYAWRPPLPGEEADENSLKLLAVALPVSYFEELTDVFKALGMKVVRAVPDVCVLERLLQEYPTDEEKNAERCFLEINEKELRMQVFKNGRFKLAHVMDSV